ncbi:MAG: hypothetical protein IPI45_07325 [Saprospiraceae bacterium]|nr:hypothetical protein [Saprospiraceae bacterium]MBK7737572.1 hypothetical protein [Saprospiraceae bacterium]MBK7913843.1 hypothetical protein [Saprospiraceae bacterium]
MMKSEINQLDLFDQYLTGKMDAMQKAAFEERLLVDEEFSQSYRLFRQMVAGIQYTEENKMRQQIRRIINKEKNYFFTHKTLKKMKKYFNFQLAAAAAVLLLLSTGIYFYLNKGDLSQEAFAEIQKMEIRDVNAYMDQLQAPGFAKMDENRLDSLQAAIELFELGKIKEAKVLFSSYLKLYPDDALAIFKMGEIEMSDENYDKAIDNYKMIVHLNDFELKDYAQLHLGQCLVLFDGKQSKQLAIKYFKMVLNHPNTRLHPIAKAYIEMNQ